MKNAVLEMLQVKSQQAAHLKHLTIASEDLHRHAIQFLGPCYID